MGIEILLLLLAIIGAVLFTVYTIAKKLITAWMPSMLGDALRYWLEDDVDVEAAKRVDPAAQKQLREAVLQRAEDAKSQVPFEPATPKIAAQVDTLSAGQRAQQRWRQRRDPQFPAQNAQAQPTATPAVVPPDADKAPGKARRKDAFIEAPDGTRELIEGDEPIVDVQNEPRNVDIPEDQVHIPADGGKLEYGVRFRDGNPGRRLRDKRYERNSVN